MSESNLEQIRRMVDQLSFADKLSLIEHLAKQLRHEPEPLVSEPPLKTQDLYGMWRGHIPDDFDLDATLKEIRCEWEKEWPQVFEK